MRKNTFEKKRVSTRFCRVARVTSQPSRSTGFAGFLLIPIFCLTRIDPTTGSTCQADPDLITMP